MDGPELGGNLTMEVTFQGATIAVIDLCLLGMFPGLMEIGGGATLSMSRSKRSSSVASSH